jgi:hypothetical protein
MRLGVSASLLTFALASTALSGQVSQSPQSSGEPATRAQGTTSTPGTSSTPERPSPAGAGSTTGTSSTPERPSPAGAGSTTGTSSTPERPSASGAAVVTAPAPQQTTPIGRPNVDLAPQSAAPGSPSPCGGRPSTGATAPATSSFPGVSAAQLPRAGVSADAFVRPGVSAAQLSTLLPGARSSPCAPPRDFIPYPDAGTPSRRAPPPSEDRP